jgi:capsular polysaccharide biosynthesis protein
MDQNTHRVSAFDAVRRYWWLLVVLGAIGAAAAYFVARDQRKPVFTAEARLAVGRIDVSTQSIPGFATASQLLADSYSRAIVATNVTGPAAKKSGLPQSKIADELTASPIPESGIIRVEAKSSDAAESIAVVNAGADSLTAFVRNLNRANPDSKRMLDSYRQASRKHARAVAARVRLSRQTSGKKRATPAQIAKADAAAAAAQLEQNTFADLYRATQSGQAAPNTLQILAYASRAKSDKNEFLQRAAFGGAVGGMILALVVALLLANRRARRETGDAGGGGTAETAAPLSV